MSNSLFSVIRRFLKNHGPQVYVPLLLTVLTVMSFCICKKPAADSLLLPEWGSKYLLLPIFLSAAILAAFKKLSASLSLYIGYHAGLALAMLGTDPGVAHFPYGLITLFATLLFSLTLGIWGEIFLFLLSRWDQKKEAPVQ